MVDVSAGNLGGLVGFSFGSNQFIGLSVASFAQAADGTVVDVLAEVLTSVAVAAANASTFTYAVTGITNSPDQISLNVFAAGTTTVLQSLTYNVIGYNAQSILISSMTLPAVIAALQAGQSIDGQVGVIAAEFPGNGANLVFDPGGTFVPCFALGTRIRTRRGEVAVQDLRAGDELRGQVSKKRRRVRWVGRRMVNVAQHSRPCDVAPVRVRRGALSPGRPFRDLLLSPDHAVLVEGALVPVRYLINGASVVQEFVPTITYLHVELDAHDVLLAEGLPCESYLDTGNRGAFADAPGLLRRALRSWRPTGAMIAENPPQQNGGPG